MQPGPKKLPPLILSCLLLPNSVFGLDTDVLIDELLQREYLPRVLNSEDLPNVKLPAAWPLLSPEGDFNGDGITDVAISGIYQLPASKNRYFLLVATQYRDPVRSEVLYLKQFTQAVYIHRPGTTGEGDPKDQAFSISFCHDCEDGIDLYWNQARRIFEERRWKATRRPHTPVASSSAFEVPADQADNALKVVGALKDVEQFIAAAKKRKNEIAVRALYESVSDKNAVMVTILERRGKRETVYDSISVDTGRMVVIRRRRKTR